MDIDYSLNHIRIQKTGFFYQGEHKVIYSEFKKLSDSAWKKKRWREIVKDENSQMNELAKQRYKYYMKVLEVTNMETIKCQSDAEYLEGLRSGAITSKTIRDSYVKDILKNFDIDEHLAWIHQIVMKKRQFGNKILTASGIADKETD